MGHIQRTFRLTNEPGGLGLSCTSEGLSLAGVPLLRKSEAGFVPRAVEEVEALMRAAYGPESDPAKLVPSLGLIARALNRGELPRAMITAVLTKTEELDWSAASRLAKIDQALAKYDPDQPRDWHGRWTIDGGAAPGTSSSDERTGSEDRPPLESRSPSLGQDVENDRNVPPPASSITQQKEPDEQDDEPPPKDAREAAFRAKYDNLGPVDFSKQAILFGDQLERRGKDLTPAEREDALAEYSFLQDRLATWMHYDYLPEEAHANLKSAALALYDGAVNSGIIGVGGKHDDIPHSLLIVLSGSAFLDNSQPSSAFRRPWAGERIEDEGAVPLEGVDELGRSGGIVLNTKAKIRWRTGINEQGKPLEVFYSKENPELEHLEPNAKTFDHFDAKEGEAISQKTLDTVTMGYIKNPGRIYNALKGYIDAAADYSGPRTRYDLNLDEIRSKTVHVAIPEYTSPTQWRQIAKAMRYGDNRNVSVIITRIRE